MPEDTMTPRERWLAVLNRQRPDRVPTDYWATAETTVRLIRYLGLSQKSEAELLDDFGRSNADDPVVALPTTDVRRLAFEALQELHVDFDFVLRIGPRYAGPSLQAQSDPFGCRYQNVDYGAGVYAECIYHPLAQYQSVQEIEDSYTWPDADWWD